MRECGRQVAALGLLLGMNGRLPGRQWLLLAIQEEEKLRSEGKEQFTHLTIVLCNADSTFTFRGEQETPEISITAFGSQTSWYKGESDLKARLSFFLDNYQ